MVAEGTDISVRQDTSLVYNKDVSIRCSKKKSIIFPIDGFSNLYLALCDRVTLNGVRKIRFHTKKTSQTVL